MESIMNRDEAIKAIGKAEHVFVHVNISTSYDGRAHHARTFRVSKVDAIAAMREISDLDCKPLIEISDDGATAYIGKEPTTQLEENFSHFENNNGNF
jgi:hypothetical protein